MGVQSYLDYLNTLTANTTGFTDALSDGYSSILELGRLAFCLDRVAVLNELLCPAGGTGVFMDMQSILQDVDCVSFFERVSEEDEEYRDIIFENLENLTEDDPSLPEFASSVSNLLTQFITPAFQSDSAEAEDDESLYDDEDETQVVYEDADFGDEDASVEEDSDDWVDFGDEDENLYDDEDTESDINTNVGVIDSDGIIPSGSSISVSNLPLQDEEPDFGDDTESEFYDSDDDYDSDYDLDEDSTNLPANELGDYDFGDEESEELGDFGLDDTFEDDDYVVDDTDLDETDGEADFGDEEADFGDEEFEDSETSFSDEVDEEVDFGDEDVGYSGDDEPLDDWGADFGDEEESANTVVSDEFIDFGFEDDIEEDVQPRGGIEYSNVGKMGINPNNDSDKAVYSDRRITATDEAISRGVLGAYNILAKSSNMLLNRLRTARSKLNETSTRRETE